MRFPKSPLPSPSQSLLFLPWSFCQLPSVSRLSPCLSLTRRYLADVEKTSPRISRRQFFSVCRRSSRSISLPQLILPELCPFCQSLSCNMSAKHDFLCYGFSL